MRDAPRIEKLQRSHAVDAFDCGQENLNRFLVRNALQNQQSGSSTTYVALAGEDIICYYTLAFGHIEYKDATPRIIKGLGKYPIPIMLLARLATSVNWQGKGIGRGLLKDAVLRTLQAADIAGLRAIAAHAKDDNARAFYEKYDFAPSPTDDYHMMVLLKDIRAAIGIA